MLSGCTLPPDSKETELGNSNQKASPLADKNTMSLQLCGVDISEVRGVICYDR